MSSKSLQTGILDRRFSISGSTLILAILLAVAFLIRIWQLGSIPAALHPDELAGVVGVLDELTHRAPLRAFFDFRIMYLPLYGVCEYLMTFFFGNSSAAFRFPAVVFGVLTAFFTTALTERLTRDRAAGLLAGAIMAILPWDVTISRVGWEPAAMLPFLLGGLWTMRTGIEKRRTGMVLVAGALFGIGAYSYRAALPSEAFLCVALLLADWNGTQRAWRAIAASIVLWIVVLMPLIFSVWGDPDFFWRDRRISTFAQGVNAHSLELFAHNYLAHFDFNAIFRNGDGNPNHGPPTGVLYLWMLPWIVFGAIVVWQRYGPRLGAFLTVWLAIYPLGGAATNDGVPHFLRTLIGAPLACILAAIGLSGAWVALSHTNLRAYRATLASVLGLLVVAEFAAFCRVYFVEYIPISARAYQFENRELFGLVRTFAPSVTRVCFLDLNPMNSLTLFGYYLRGSALQIHEGAGPECSEPRSLIVSSKANVQPASAHLVATAERYDGSIADYLYLTSF
ncbi:MAG: glycosyltransferase family 39 protein [Candidatus Baltobacteraceae bacterium]